ncbi:MAG: hypothetical protein OXE84_00725 [Rhodobacteraceae bacterium]|nr:hypothetical protein [Paracoccaceae bacterium]MCY4195635.1 hypothetical protein [Paracoccaceae bacterium]MCY4328263.1 hypothetical protein [Paracoccaceae bacterium]
MNTLIISRIVRPDLYSKFLHASIAPAEIMAYFGATENVGKEMMNGEPNPEYDSEIALYCYMWPWLSSDGKSHKEHSDVLEYGGSSHIPKLFSEHGMTLGRSPKSVPMQVHRQWVNGWTCSAFIDTMRVDS